MSSAPEETELTPSETDAEATKASTSERLWAYTKEGITKSALQTKLALEHSLGLGAKPNVVPPGEADTCATPRTVEIGWHPVGGTMGKWFAEQTKLGKLITEKIDVYPDPTQHWAVLVGGFAHQLWMKGLQELRAEQDEHLDVIYFNEVLKREDWHTYPVGSTTFNDNALLQAAEMTIYNMRLKRAAYNLISNNCQNFALNLLDHISVGKHREFGSTFAIYQRATGKGKIKNLFEPEQAESNSAQPAVSIPEPYAPVPRISGAGEESAQGDGLASEEAIQAIAGEETVPGRPKLQRHDTVATAAEIMDKHTTKLDGRHSL